MQFSRTNLAVSLIALALVGCGKARTLPAFETPGETEGSFVQGGESIEIAGQKGVGKREGNDYIKTFTVDNKKSLTENIANTQTTKSTTITIIESVSNKEDNWLQPNNYRYYEFLLSQVPYQGVIDEVYLNGSRRSSSEYAYNAQNGTLYFPNHYVNYGVSIRAVYRVSSGPHPSYVFDTNTNAVGVSMTNPSTGAAVQGSFSGNVAYITGVAAGQQVLVKYYLPDQSTVSGTLQFEPIAGSVKLNLAQCSNSIVTVTGKQFSAPCVAYDVASIPVSYDYSDPSLQLFNIPEVPNADVGTWEVRINGVVSQVYRRQGSKFFIDQVIPHGAKVEIIHRKQ